MPTIDYRAAFVKLVVMPRLSFSHLGDVKKYLHRRTLVALIGTAILVAGFGMFMQGRGAAVQQLAAASRAVETKTIAELSSEATPLSIVGSVTSRSEATVRAESSGEVTDVYRQLGDSVGAGTVVAELDNDSERASVMQAKGSVDAAEANLSKVKSGTRPEQVAILKSSVEGARSGVVNALLGAYTSIDNAIQGGVDVMFNDADSGLPIFRVALSDSQLTADVQNKRAMMGIILQRQGGMAQTIAASSDLVAELTIAEREVRSVRNFLDDIVLALNKKAVPTSGITASTIASYQASAIAARTAINASLTSIAGAKQALQTADKNLEQGIGGPISEDLASAEAALTQAKGVYAGALANLEKTIVRSPISGTINSFSLNRGDYVQATTPLLTVANNGALEVLAYVTEQDVVDIAVGDRVTFEGSSAGIVTRIAPALDPVTKKIEIRVGVQGGGSSLVNGQSVTVTFLRKMVTTKSKVSRVTIPISAIKVGANETQVFTVDENGLLVGHPIVIGELLGDRVVVRSGVTSDMRIVTDARGLRTGQAVQLK